MKNNHLYNGYSSFYGDLGEWKATQLLWHVTADRIPLHCIYCCIRTVHQDGGSNLVYRIKITWWQYFVLVADVSDGRVCGCVAVPREVVWNLYKPLLLLPVATRPTYVQLNVNVITDSEQVTSFLNTCRKLKVTQWLPLYIDIMLSYSCPFMGNGNGIT